MQGGSDKNTKQLEAQLAELNAKLEQALRDIQELTSAKSKAQAEATDVGRKLEEAESQLNQLTKAKQTMSKQLEEAKAGVEEESRLKTKLQGENRNLQADLDQLREQLEEEQSGRADMQRALTKANNEVSASETTFLHSLIPPRLIGWLWGFNGAFTQIWRHQGHQPSQLSDNFSAHMNVIMKLKFFLDYAHNLLKYPAPYQKR